MNKQQKIVEMAKDICRVKHICNDVCKPISTCDALKYAERAVEAGYCKQSVGTNLSDYPSLFECSVCHWCGKTKLFKWRAKRAWNGRADK